MFHSHAGIEHLRVDWNNHPLLLFADMEATDYANVWQYQLAEAVTTLRQNVTMGLKKGNTVLLHFQYQGHFYQVILMMAGSVCGSKGGVDTHKLWKHASLVPRGCPVSSLKPSVSLPSRWTRICENHARKMRTFFTRRLEPKTKSSNAFKWSLRPKRK